MFHLRYRAFKACAKLGYGQIRSISTVSSLKGRSVMSIFDLSKKELHELLGLSAALKRAHEDKKLPLLMKQKTMAMIFQKRSTRTRVSSETGLNLLGGHALFLGPQDIQLGVNESLLDTARVLSRFNDLILARVYAHSDVEELSREATVPVINALSDLHHPLQTFADLLTMQERFDGKLEKRTVAWVGDGNNVLHDLMGGCLKMGMNVRVATPTGFRPDKKVMEQADLLARDNGLELTLTDDPHAAAHEADVIVTDTFVSMGQEEEAKARLAAFDGFCVDGRLMSLAKKDAIFMHCLPRHKEEVSDDVFYGKQSVVWDEAENRMWTVMALALSMVHD